MGDTFITDITHFEGIPPHLAKGPAGRIAEYFGSIVSVASVSPIGRWIDVAIRCRRRPGRKRCPGHIQLRRRDSSGPIRWQCTSCDDQGEISKWKGSTWDLSSHIVNQADTEGSLEILLSEEEVRELRQIVVLEPESQRILDRAVVTPKVAIIQGREEDFDSLLDSISAEANHEENRRRRNILDRVYDKIEAFLDSCLEEMEPLEEDEDVLPVLSPEIERFLKEVEQRL